MNRTRIGFTCVVALALGLNADLTAHRPELSPCEAYGAADAVFIGEAKPRLTRGVSVERGQIGPEPHTVIASLEFTPLAVERAFRGVTTSVVYVDMNLKPFERYLVYGSAYMGADMFMTQDLYGTKPLSQATTELEFLDVVLANASGAAISGILELDESDVSQIGTNVRPLANVVVRFSDGGRQGAAFTSADGHFTAGRLEPGTYTADAQLADDLALVKEPAPIVRVRGRGCASLLLRAVPNGHVRGVMRSTAGQPVRGEPLAIMRAKRRGEPDDSIEEVRTDDEGRFVFAGVRPGTYMLAQLSANVDGVIRPAVYYPGSFDRDAAAIIVVGRSTDQDVGEFRVPPVRRQ